MKTYIVLERVDCVLLQEADLPLLFPGILLSAGKPLFDDVVEEFRVRQVSYNANTAYQALFIADEDSGFSVQERIEQGWEKREVDLPRGPRLHSVPSQKDDAK